MMDELEIHGRPDSPSVMARKPGILIADDMGLVLTLLKFELEPRGFAVWLAVDGDDAIDLYRRNHAEVDLVLLDVQMPGMDGPRALAALQRLDPDILACFMTGSSRTYTEEELLEYGAECVFHKPFHAVEVAQCLQTIFEARDTRTRTSQSPRNMPRNRGLGETRERALHKLIGDE